MRSVQIVFVLLFLVAVGCSGEQAPIKVEQKVAPVTEAAKAILQTVADSGELGSGTMELRATIEKIKETDAAKGDALLADLDALEKMGDVEQVKAKAAEMAGKL